MAPMLSFTAEEAWAVFAGEQAYADSDETIFTQTYWTLPEVAGRRSPAGQVRRLCAKCAPT